MERVIVASIRGIVCGVTLAALAACNGEGSAAAPTPTAVQPAVTKPVSPQPSSVPTTSKPSNPTIPAEPVDPTEPATPAEPTPDEPVSSNGNAAPQIAGSPASEVVVGQNFNFTPNATDAEGDSLTFSIASKPAWASFDASTGHLWGTPGAADVGSHEDIMISVSDGAHTEALPQFAVNVVEQTNGSVTLAWEPPTQNTDGSALTNLKGYKIHYGSTPGAYEQTLTVNNAGLSTYVIENLAAGTYYFAISAVSTNGIESELSAEASKTL